MGKNRNAVERVDEQALSEMRKSLADPSDRLKVSDTHDRLGTIISDVRDGTERHPSRYDANTGTEYYPVGQHSNASVGDLVEVGATCTAGDPIQTIQPPAGELWDVLAIFEGSNVLAAPRRLTVQITDTVSGPLPLADNNAIPASAYHQLYPYDTIAAALVGYSWLKITNATYLRFVATGLVAAEEIIPYVHRIRYYVGGLRA